MEHSLKKIIKLIDIFFVFAFISYITIDYVFFSKNKIAIRGTENKLEKVDLSLQNFTNNSFQNYLETKIKNGDIFAKNVVKINNYLNFKILNHTNAGVIVGKNKFLFADGYIFEKFCINNIYSEYEKVKEQVKKIEKVQNILKSKNIKFVYVLAPNKADFYEEYIPYKFKDNCKNNRKYDLFVNEIKKTNINFIDVNEYFLSLKSKMKKIKNNKGYAFDGKNEKLFPRYGIHWTQYGFSYFLQNKLIPYLENLYGRKFNDIEFSYMTSKTPLGSNFDLGFLLGLEYEKFRDSALYPQSKEIKNSGYKPKLLTISDSFADIFASNINLYDYFEVDLQNVSWSYYLNRYFYDENNVFKIEPLNSNVNEKINYIKNKDLIIFMHTTPAILHDGMYKFFDDIINNF